MVGVKSVRFVANGMCGKLRRWLRLLGYDVKYAKNAPDDLVISVAKEGGRVILTADDVLHKKALSRGARSFLIKEIDEARQLALIAREFGITLDVDEAYSRCPICNSRIRPIEGKYVKGHVPKSTLKFYDDFWICLGCGKIYWHGSHWKNITLTLRKASKIVGES